MHNPVSLQENETQNSLGFGDANRFPNLARRPDFLVINNKKKRTC